VSQKRYPGAVKAKGRLHIVLKALVYNL